MGSLICRTMAVSLLAGFLFAMLPACEEDTFEKAGKKLDKTVQEAREEIRKTAEKVKRAVEE